MDIVARVCEQHGVPKKIVDRLLEIEGEFTDERAKLREVEKLLGELPL